MRYLYKIIKRIFKAVNLELVSIDPSKGILVNVFNTDFNKNALISYIKTPFQKDIHYYHTNYSTCRIASEIIKSLGYNVDVVDYRYNPPIDYSKYSLIYGFGLPLDVYFLNYYDPDVIVITYNTGCSVQFSNEVSLRRLMDFFNETGKLEFKGLRFHPYDMRIQQCLSNLNIILGNDFVKQTYNYTLREDNCTINNFFYKTTDDKFLQSKDFSAAKKNYIWFGSTGYIHKGLDLVIRNFLNRDDINLHICGAEPSIMKIFYNEKEDYPHIYWHGYIDIWSDLFKKLMKECGFLVFPSVSEGMVTSVLTVCGNGGLIPIISKNTGINIAESIILDDFSYKSVEVAIEKVLKIDIETLKIKSNNIFNRTREIYTQENYKESLRKLIIKGINNSPHFEGYNKNEIFLKAPFFDKNFFYEAN